MIAQNLSVALGDSRAQLSHEIHDQGALPLLRTWQTKGPR
jgi:hypothetical protein